MSIKSNCTLANPVMAGRIYSLELRYSCSHKQGLEYHTLDCLRMPFDTTAMLFLFALFAGSLAASLSAALLYFKGSITTPGVFRIFGRVRFLQHASRVLKSGLSHAYRSSVCSILFTGDVTVSGMHLADRWTATASMGACFDHTAHQPETAEESSSLRMHRRCQLDIFDNAIEQHHHHGMLGRDEQ